MRKTERVIVPEWGARDSGKVFVLTEMSALLAEKWAMKAILAFKGTGGFIPEEIEHLGMVGVAIRGINAFLAAPVRFEEVEPLLDEMMSCVQAVRDKRYPDAVTHITSEDIEEVRTYTWLRGEVLRLHTGFSLGDALSGLLSKMQTTSPDSPNTSTSPAQ